jgi:hypothetical protein
MGANVQYKEWPHDSHTFGANNYIGRDELKDTIGKTLRHIMPKVKGTGIDFIKEKHEDWEEFGTLFKYEQSEFLDKDEWEMSNMFDFGYLYVPHKCN